MILRILPLLTILLFLPIWGMNRMSLRHHLSKPLRWVLAMPNVLLFVALAAMAINESYSTEAMYWKGLLLTWTLCLTIPEAVTALLMLVGKFFQGGSRARHIVHGLAWGLGLIVFGTLAYGFTGGYKHIIVKNYTYASAKLPKAFDGYRIMQFTDIHVGTFNGNTEVVKAIVDTINAYEPDLVVFTGDLVNTLSRELDDYTEVLSQFKAVDGVISIAGNHDYAGYFKWANAADSLADIHRLQQAERDMGWRLLLNENKVLHRGNDSIAIIGVENDGLPPFPMLGDLTKAQQGVAPDCFKVLLSHDPTHWRRNVLPETNIDLTLSGHTHGMQFKIGNFSPASFFYPEWGGEYREADGRALYVSLGCGEALLPFRFGAWPEVNLITLRKNK